MSDVVQAALIGAGAATLGGLIAGGLNIGLEYVRIRNARKDRRRDELRDALTSFFVREREWRNAFESIPPGQYDQHEEWVYPLAVAFREASHKMTLLAPDEIYTWWRDDFSPVRDAFEDVAGEFADKGIGTEAEREAAFEKVYQEIVRGRELCRKVLHKK